MWRVDFQTSFLHVALPEFLKNVFVSEFWSQHRGAELACQRIFLEFMTYNTRKVQKEEERLTVKTRTQRFQKVSNMVYCFAVDCKNDSSKTKGVSHHRFPKYCMLYKEQLAKISRENSGLAHLCCVFLPHLKKWPLVF